MCGFCQVMYVLAEREYVIFKNETECGFILSDLGKGYVNRRMAEMDSMPRSPTWEGGLGVSVVQIENAAVNLSEASGFHL